QHDEREIEQRDAERRAEAGDDAAPRRPAVMLRERELHFLPTRLVDLVEDAAIGEMRRLRLAPAAEDLVDCEERDLRELVGMPRGDLGKARPVEIARRELLALGGVEESEIGLGRLARAVPVDIGVDER